MNIITMIGDDEFVIFDCIDQFSNVIIGDQLMISTESFGDRLGEKNDEKKFREVS